MEERKRFAIDFKIDTLTAKPEDKVKLITKKKKRRNNWLVGGGSKKLCMANMWPIENKLMLTRSAHTSGYKVQS